MLDYTNSNMELISIRKYAQRKGCSDPAVLKAIKTGKIINGCIIDEKGNKKIIPEIADAEWKSNSDPVRAKMGARFDIPSTVQESVKQEAPAPSPAPKPKPKPKPSPKASPALESNPKTAKLKQTTKPPKSTQVSIPAADVAPVVPDRTTLKPVQDDTLAAARKAQEVYKAKIAELDYKKRIGDLVAKDEVYKSLFAFGQELRTQFQAIPDRVVDNMLAASSRNEAHIILYEAITKVLENLADIESRKIT